VSSESDTAYQVLARKYRPRTFADLKGQEAMVRALRNAFRMDRIAQAFILTGIRGTGKTTTARIVAKGLNCVGPDGTGRPTTEPCGVCEPCRAIAAGRHVDVLEMDAASNTGVDDVREIIEGVRYRAASARYKVYIVDEVHMLSTNAFNALLKTLEEPPAHVKFIFATTEIGKVPVTVLSRCQRFDLRRIEPEAMIAHLAEVAGAEGAAVESDALALIARAAEGSARDAMSLLDQAIALGGAEAGEEAGAVTAPQVRAMLGLADRGRVLDLFELVMKGDAAGALEALAAQHAEGADPAMVLRDLAEVTHWVSVCQVAPSSADDPTIGPDERARGQAFAQALPMRSLTRAWQMLLKALEEVAAAPSPMMAAEMAVIRLTHVADLPSPDELIRRLREAPEGAAGGAAGAPSAPAPAVPAAPGPDGRGDRIAEGAAGRMGGAATAEAAPARPGGTLQEAPRGASQGANHGASHGSAARGAAAPAPAPGAGAQAAPLARYGAWRDVLALIRANRDVALLLEVESGVRLVSYAPGRIEFEPAPGAAPDLAARLGSRLQGWTGARWGVSVVSGGGAPTLREAEAAEGDRARAEALEHPLTRAALAAFPGAEIVEVRRREDAEPPLADVPDEWDPFEAE
jgi:DNA polymerase-3 subunit gamma/tau